MTLGIQCKQVSVRLGDFTALSEVDCDIPASSFCVVHGPNGAGKSTFLKALQGIVPLASGSITINGKSPSQTSPQQMAIVPQIKNYDRHFPARSIDLVATGLLGRWPWNLSAVSRGKCLQALEDVGMADVAERPLGVLSGGELQRVYVARVLVRQPEIVLLDEPATGMDVTAEQDLHHLLERYQQKTKATIIMISHDWDTSRHHASHVLLLNQRMRWFGSVADGPSEEIMRSTFGHVGHAHPMQHGGHDHDHDHEHSHD